MKYYLIKNSANFMTPMAMLALIPTQVFKMVLEVIHLEAVIPMVVQEGSISMTEAFIFRVAVRGNKLIQRIYLMLFLVAGGEDREDRSVGPICRCTFS